MNSEPESQFQRNLRVREAKFGTPKGKTRAKSRQTPTPEKQTHPWITNKVSRVPWSIWRDLPQGAIRDIIIGLAYGAIPVLIALFLLPDGLKILAFPLFALTGFVGYMLGASTT
jgi:hypothetical protein